MLRFTIIDYTTNPLGDSIEIDEPIGWDGINLRLKRDKTWHGFFDFADDSISSLQFVGDGFGILKTAYETYGASANVQLLVEFQCAEGDTYQELYLGRFVFSSYKDICGDECYSTITLEALNCLMIFRNRYDQQVDLDSLAVFDADTCASYSNASVYTVFTVSSSFTVTGVIIPNNVTGQWIKILNTVYNNGTYLITNIVHSGADTIVTVDATMVLELGVYASISTYCLAPYEYLNKKITIPSKIVFLESKAISNDTDAVHAIQNPTSSDYPTGYLPDFSGGYLTGERTGWFTLPSNVILSDLSTMNGSIEEYAPHGIRRISFPSALLKLDLLPICPSFEVRIQVSFTGTFVNTGSSNREEDLKIIIAIGNDTAYGATVIDNTTLYGYTGSSPDTQPFNYSFDGTFTVNAGQSIYYYFFYQCFKSDSLQNDPIINFSNDVVFDLSSESECNPTKATVYLINESLSRCVEATTNDCMRVYSDYFGRTDAQPYTSVSDGCGSLRAITNGLRIRNAPNSDGNTPQKFTISMQDMFNALNATDNIGMALEDDTVRGGDYKWIRVEPFDYFYKSDILMECDHIRKVERSVDASLIFSTIKIGYDKWKTWNINGLNDIFTPHEYRTELSELKNELDQLCKFLASDYAIEWTRRQYGLTTADSRYDNDNFFLCLSRQPYSYEVEGQFLATINLIIIQGQDFEISEGDIIYVSGTTSNNGNFTVLATSNGAFYTTEISVLEVVTNENTGTPFTIDSVNVNIRVEQGVDTPTNILEPDTVMNYRLAPSRNAMRWFKSILMSYRNFLTKKIIFTQGEGNILASGEVLTPCRLENAVIAENEDISLDLFDSPTDNYPLFYPELVIFEYPMSYDEYLTVKSNPYGLIGYQCGNGTMEYGWIEDMQYSPYKGLVNFALRPKIA